MSSSGGEAGRWNERYGSASYFYGTEPNDFVVETADRIRTHGNVLCLAEGEGRNAVYLAKQGHHVTAVDQSLVGLEKARRLAAESRVQIEIVPADLADYDLGTDRWDAILSVWCHLPSALRAVVHRGCVRALKPGGVFILESYTPDQLRHGTGGPKDLDLLPTLAMLQMELQGLVLDVAVERERVVHEGKGHDGMSAVVQLVGRKV